MEPSRRSAIGALACAALTARVSPSAQKAAAYGLIGDRYHNSDYIRTGLNRTIAKDLGVSIDFCDEVGLDYVSCSPYRVPIARLAAAQTVVARKSAAERGRTV